MLLRIQTDSLTVNLTSDCDSGKPMGPDENKYSDWVVLLIPSDTESKTEEEVVLTDKLDLKLSPIFKQKLIAALTNRDRTSRELRECNLAKEKRRCKTLGNYCHQRETWQLLPPVVATTAARTTT